MLLVLPLVALFAIFAREREARIDHALELSHAYKGTALLLGDVIGALLHDVGKINVPKAIINKPGPLDDEEWAVMKTHTVEPQPGSRAATITPAGRRALRRVLGDLAPA